MAAVLATVVVLGRVRGTPLQRRVAWAAHGLYFDRSDRLLELAVLRPMDFLYSFAFL